MRQVRSLLGYKESPCFGDLSELWTQNQECAEFGKNTGGRGMTIYKILIVVNQHCDADLPKTIHELTKLPVDDICSISWKSGDDLKRLPHEIIRPLNKMEAET